jgi:hypothetical protein
MQEAFLHQQLTPNSALRKAHPPQELQPFEADLQPVEATAVRAAAANIMAKRNLRIGNPSLDGESARFERIRGFPSSGEVQVPSESAADDADRF